MDAKPDFHVVFLRYKLRPSDQVTYVSPTPVEFETEEGRFRLAEGKLTCELKSHFSTAKEAQAVVVPVLRAWEVDADLRRTRGELRFEFDGADIIDRSPLPPGVIRGHLHALTGEVALSAAGTVSFHLTRVHYPEPPGTFRLNPDAESILLRYQGYLDGREPLLAMGYFCLTVLFASASSSSASRTTRDTRPGRAKVRMAAKKYRIEEAVLRKMAELTTRRGDRTSARKATAGPALPLTSPEKAWLEAALQKFIWRLGDTRPVTALPVITLADLPRL